MWLVDEADKLLEGKTGIQKQLKALASSQPLEPNIAFILADLSHPRDLVDNEFSSFYSSFHDIYLEPLSPRDARKLVIEPVQGHFSYEEEAIEMIIQESNREPYWIQLLCREALSLALAQNRTVVTLEDARSARRYGRKHPSTSVEQRQKK